MHRARPDNRHFYRSRPPTLEGGKTAIQSSVPPASPGLAMPARAAARISSRSIQDHARVPDRGAAAGAARHAPGRQPHHSNVFPCRQSAQIKAGLRDQLRRVLALARSADFFEFEEGNEAETNDESGRQANETRN